MQFYSVCKRGHRYHISWPYCPECERTKATKHEGGCRCQCHSVSGMVTTPENPCFNCMHYDQEEAVNVLLGD